VRDAAYLNHYLNWAYLAAAQGETDLAHEYFYQVFNLNPAVIGDDASKFVDSMIATSIRDGGEHEPLLRSVFSQIPPEFSSIAQRCDWAIARGYLLRGTREIIWGKPEEGAVLLARAAEMGAELDASFLNKTVHQLVDHEVVFGTDAMRRVLPNLVAQLSRIGNPVQIRQLQGQISINQAFAGYRLQHYRDVPLNIIQAVAHDPGYLANRGVLSIFARSLVGMVQQMKRSTP
jgi:hypothetical protein